MTFNFHRQFRRFKSSGTIWARIGRCNPADVHRLPFCDSSLDRVTYRCGIMFFADIATALKDKCYACSNQAAAPLF